MYKSGDGFEAPASNAKVWRYSGLTKLIRVLQRRALFFSSASRLTDCYEGSLTRPSLEQCIRIFMENGAISEQRACDVAASCVGMIGVNCWHLSEHESAAMWQLYSRDRQGIVIQSTFDRLCQSVRRHDKHVWIGKVRYIDYAKDEIDNVTDVKQWFLHKRREFQYEQELRAMIILTPGEPGQEVVCDLEALIESIWIAPEAPPYMLELVSEVCKRFDVAAEIKASTLDDPTPLRQAAPES